MIRRLELVFTEAVKLRFGLESESTSSPSAPTQQRYRVLEMPIENP